MVGKIARWIIGSFLSAVVFGTLVWFIMSVLGRDLDYFTYIRGWFFAMLVIDIVLDLWLWNRKRDTGGW